MPYAKTVENARFVREFRAEPRYAQTMNEAEYVAMRRVDEGLDQLQFAAPPVANTPPTPRSWLGSELPQDDGGDDADEPADDGQSVGPELSAGEVDRLKRGEQFDHLAGRGSARFGDALTR
jgi:hypothetical protein